VIQLKNIKHSEFASEETHCYEATLYVDGVRWGFVSNSGHGGPDHFYGGPGGRNYGDLMALNERIAAAYPRITFGDYDAAANLETVCGDLVNAFLRQRHLKSLLSRGTKTKVLYFKEPPVEGAPLFTQPLKTHSLEAMVKFIATKYPTAVVINILPQDQALKLLALAA